jgi:hypothetical protein
MEMITVTFKDHRSPKVYRHKGRAGGSYTIGVRYEVGWVVITDEWGHEDGFPSADVESVEARERGW